MNEVLRSIFGLGIVWRGAIRTLIWWAMLAALPSPGICTQPESQLEWKTLDFYGEATQRGEVISGQFHFRNSGPAAITINKVVTGCICLKAESNQNVIAPGEEGRIEFQFDTTGRRGVTERRILVVSDDPKEPRVLLKILVKCR